MKKERKDRLQSVKLILNILRGKRRVAVRLRKTRLRESELNVKWRRFLPRNQPRNPNRRNERGSDGRYETFFLNRRKGNCLFSDGEQTHRVKFWYPSDTTDLPAKILKHGRITDIYPLDRSGPTRIRLVRKMSAIRITSWKCKIISFRTIFFDGLEFPLWRMRVRDSMDFNDALRSLKRRL